MQELKVELSGTLSVTLSPGGCSPNPGNTTGPTLALELREKNANPKTYAGTVIVPINSPGSYVTLPMQPTQRCALLMIDTFDAEFLVRLTRVDTTTLVIPLQGLIVMEIPWANLVTLIEVQGSGPVAWHASGPLA